MTTLEAILFESDDENIPQYVGPQANVENEILLQNGESHLTTPVDFKSPLKPANSPPLPPPLPPPPPPPPLLLPPPLPPSCDRAFLEHYCHSLDGQNDEPPLGGSNLILKIERFAETFNNIMGSLNLERSTVNSTLQDIKSSAKIDVQMFFAAKNSLTTEFSKLETIWHLRHPEEAYAFEMKDLSHAIARQNRLTTSVDN